MAPNEDFGEILSEVFTVLYAIQFIYELDSAPGATYSYTVVKIKGSLYFVIYT